MSNELKGTLRDLAPPGLRHLLPPVFDRPKPNEPHATCDDCAMCKDEDPNADKIKMTALEKSQTFRPDAKCCTYHPTLPNFYVGELLADKDPANDEGRKRVRQKLGERHGVSPFWLRGSRKTRVLLSASRFQGFGKSKALLCPFYTDDHRCSIWPFREAVCSTWYCKHEKGATGRFMWMALKDWLIHIERRLVGWATNEVDPTLADDPMNGARMSLNDIEGKPPSDEEYATMWKDWRGREEELYVATYEKVQSLPPQKALEIMLDPVGRQLLTRVADTHDGVTAGRLSERLVPASVLWRKKYEKGDRIVSYSNFDAQFINTAVMRLLEQFDENETVDELINRMRRDHGMDVPRALIQRLQDFEVLVPPTHDKALKKHLPVTKDEGEKTPAT